MYFFLFITTIFQKFREKVPINLTKSEKKFLKPGRENKKFQRFAKNLETAGQDCFHRSKFLEKFFFQTQKITSILSDLSNYKIQLTVNLAND